MLGRDCAFAGDHLRQSIEVGVICCSVLMSRGHNDFIFRETQRGRANMPDGLCDMCADVGCFQEHSRTMIPVRALLGRSVACLMLLITELEINLVGGSSNV